MKKFKKFVSEANTIALKNKLYVVAKQARDYVNKKYNLGDSLTNYCDVISNEVAKRLIDKEISGKIVYGDYYYQYKDSDPDYYGHTWIVVDDYIIDGSKEQFNSKEYVIKTSSKKSSNYNAHKIVSHF